MAYTVLVKFEWNQAKDASNLEKHGLSFSEAKELFESDQDYLEVFDPAHSESEDRFIAIGEIRRGVKSTIHIWMNSYERYT